MTVIALAIGTSSTRKVKKLTNLILSSACSIALVDY